MQKKRRILQLNSHPCSPWRRLPTQQASCLKAYPCTCWVHCLARKCFCLPLLKGHQRCWSLAEAAIILAESNKMLPFGYTNCRKALGWEEKPREKNKVVKGIVTLLSTEKDLPWDWILVKGLPKYAATFFNSIQTIVVLLQCHQTTICKQHVTLVPQKPLLVASADFWCT